MDIDIFVGNRTESVEDKKEKYKGIGLFMAFDVVTIVNFKPLASVLCHNDLKYIQDQVAIFMAEYQYWHACLELKKILFNDIEPENTAKKAKLIRRLENMSQIFAAYKNGDEDV
jgi:hypothetical protein